MSLIEINAESLRRDTGLPIEDLHVLVAKNSVAGLDSDDIATVLGVTTQEIAELQESNEYKSARLLIATEYSKTQVEKDFNWDYIESTALTGLAKRVHLERDSDQLLKIAAIANKAQRRTPVSNNAVLDPARGGQRVALQLSERITKKLASGETATRERHVSVLDGTAVNPKFEDIDTLFGVTESRMIPGSMPISTRTPDFDVDDLEYKG